MQTLIVRIMCINTCIQKDKTLTLQQQTSSGFFTFCFSENSKCDIFDDTLLDEKTNCIPEVASYVEETDASLKCPIYIGAITDNDGFKRLSYLAQMTSHGKPVDQTSIDAPKRDRPSFDLYSAIGGSARPSFDVAKGSMRPSFDVARRSMRPSFDVAKGSMRPSLDWGVDRFI
jgi:hypothetical protein